MIALLFSFLALALCEEYPKMSYVIISSSFRKDDYDEIEDWKDHKDELIDSCKNDLDHFSSEEREKCESFINSISSIVLSNGKDVNNRLKKVSKNTEYLFYLVHTRHIDVDFNNLPHKMMVYMQTVNFSKNSTKIFDIITDLILSNNKKVIESSFDGIPESRTIYTKFNKNNNNNNVEVLMEGSISKKVSFLTIHHLRVVYYHEFKCENVYLSSAVLVSKSNSPARIGNFIIDTQTFSYYSILHYLIADQFTLVDFNTDNDSIPEYQIAYCETFWGVQCVYDGIFIPNRYQWKVPYFVTKKFSIICYSLNFIIEAVNQSLTDYHDVNITVTNKGIIDSVPQLSSSNTITIESKGFDSINKKLWPSIVVTYNKDKFSIDKSKSILDIDSEQIYSYKPGMSFKSKYGMVVGIVAIVVVVIVVIIVVIIVVRLMKSKKNKNKNKTTNEIFEKTLLNDQNQPNNYHEPVGESPYLQPENNDNTQSPPYPPPNVY